MTETGARQSVMKWIIKQKKETICCADMIATAASLQMSKDTFYEVLKYLQTAGILRILQAEKNIITFDCRLV